MKKVVYQGQEFNAPAWAKFIAADANGMVYAYEAMPTWRADRAYYMARSFTKVEGVGEMEAAPPPVQEI